MTKESSLRIVRLSDGSELIGNINLTDEGSQFLRITDPLEILLNSKAIGVGMVEDFTSLRPWMQFANDSVFSIPKERIITICNVADDMKAYYKIINEKVKHRQWFRPFAPSIIREAVGDWFERDIDSPYMTAVIKFKPLKKIK